MTYDQFAMGSQYNKKVSKIKLNKVQFLLINILRILRTVWGHLRVTLEPPEVNLELPQRCPRVSWG